MSRRRMAVAVVFAATGVIALGTPPVGLAGNGPTPLQGSMLVSQIQAELKTATFHSGELAQKVTTLAGVQLHLHHVLNCLEGPSGADFSAQAGDPCEGQGNGIIPDLQVAAQHDLPGANAALEEAQACQALARQALSSNDLNEAQPYALVVSRHLQTADKYISE